MSDDFFKRLSHDASADQAEAGMMNMVRGYGLFYTGLTANGIPEQLAAAMVRDWHYLNMCRGLYPDQPPPQMPTGRDEL